MAPTKTVTVSEKPKAKVETKTETKTEVQYVEKTSNKDADVEITNTKPSVSVNGKKYEFEKVAGETSKFDKGKVTVEQGYKIEINAKDLVPKTPKWGMDIGYSNHGLKLGVEHNFNKNVGVYVEGTPMKQGDKDRFVGAGLKVRF